MPWLTAVWILVGVPFFVYGMAEGHRVLRLVSSTGFWTCFLLSSWIRRREMFETLRSPNAKWYSRSKSAEFSIPASSLRILVQNIDSVAPWYEEKLGLRKLAQTPPSESNAAVFRFKPDGRSVILTTRSGSQTGKTPILFTKKIDRIKKVLVERGVEAGPVEQDRQGIHYFQIHDPEGNAIEVVEEPR
jgi:predicted enzyme related to lactoylglutathione lyase